jgi:hypothetical protein
MQSKPRYEKPKSLTDPGGTPGVRPFPGAATLAHTGALAFSRPFRLFPTAAAEDGRTPPVKVFQNNLPLWLPNPALVNGGRTLVTNGESSTTTREFAA